MAKKKDKQLDLLDVGAKNLKEIRPHVEAYKEALTLRLASLADEVREKKEILRLVEKSGLKRAKDGTINFSCDGFIVKITPADDKISVKEAPEE